MLSSDGRRHLPRTGCGEPSALQPVTLLDAPDRARVASNTGKRPRGGLRREGLHAARTDPGALLAGVILTVALAAPVGAITNGQPDDGEHPYVGQLFFYVPTSRTRGSTIPAAGSTARARCISPTVVLTAGHCTFGTGLDGAATTDEDGSGGNDMLGQLRGGARLHRHRGRAVHPGRQRGPLRALPGHAQRERHVASRHGVSAPGVRQRRVLPVRRRRRDPGRAGRPLGESIRRPADAPLPRPVQGQGRSSSCSRPSATVSRRRARRATSAATPGCKSQQKIVNFNGVYGLGPNSSIVFSNNNGSPASRRHLLG